METAPGTDHLWCRYQGFTHWRFPNEATAWWGRGVMIRGEFLCDRNDGLCSEPRQKEAARSALFSSLCLILCSYLKTAMRWF